MVQQFSSPPELNDSTALHQQHAVSQTESFINIVGDQQDGFMQLCLQCLQFLLQFGPGQWIDGAKRFVHQNHCRVCRESPEYADALLLAAGKLIRITPGKFRRFHINQF